MANVYSIRKINSSKDRDIIKLMRLYSSYIEPTARTDTREILDWLDNSTDDYFKIFAFYLNETLIGYCQTAYFHFNKILFVDYLVIDENYRGRSYSEFIYSLKDYFNEKNIEINYFIAEVPYYTNSNQPSLKSITLIRLLKQSGFKVIKADYYQPELGKNKESCMQTTLLIYTNDQYLTDIKKETFEDIIKTIYSDHYYKWYSRFFKTEELKIYKAKIDSLYDEITKKIAKKKVIELNGYSHLIERNQKTPEGAIEKSNALKYTLLLLIIVAITGIIMFAVKIVSGLLGVSDDHLYYALAIVIPIAIPIAACLAKKMNKSWSLYTKK